MNAREYLLERYKMPEGLAEEVGRKLEGKNEKEWDFHCVRWLVDTLGKKEAWGYIWERCRETVGRAMVIFLRGKGLSPEDWEDIFCEVRCEIYLEIEKFDGRGSLDGFIWRISERKIKKLLSERLMERRKVDFCGDMSEWAEKGDGDGEDVVELRIAIAMLPETFRVVMVYYLEGYSYEEMAELLSCKAGTVRWRFSKALKLLKNLYGEENFWRGRQQNSQNSTHIYMDNNEGKTIKRRREN